MSVNSKTVDIIFKAIRENPGNTTYGIGKIIGKTHTQVQCMLPSLDFHGMLIYEDEKGRLYPYEQHTDF
jgi:hypothetical protein